MELLYADDTLLFAMQGESFNALLMREPADVKLDEPEEEASEEGGAPLVVVKEERSKRLLEPPA